MAAVQNKDPDRLNVVDGLEQVQRKLSRQISESIASIGSNGSRPGKPKVARKPRKGKDIPELDISRIIDMQLNARIHSLNLVLGTKNGADTSLAIKDVTSVVTMRPKLMEVTAALRAIEMLDQTPNALHRHLLAVSGDQKMFQMDFKQYNRTDEEKKAMTLSDVDMSVKIRFAQLRFVFLNLWVNRMLNWISPFQAEAAQAAAQAQALAAERAAETAANVKQIMVESPPRLQLDIELAAPAIVVPRISTSNDVLLVDLGRLQLKNGFNKAGAALIDELTIGLKDVHMGVGQLDPSQSDKVSTSCQLLKPMSFTLSVFRNLNFAQVKELPELTVKAYLPVIDVSMTQNDYTLIMHTLAGNLAEGTPPPAAAPLPPPKPKDRVADANDDPPLPKKSTVEKVKKGEAGDNADAASPAPPTSAKRIVFKFVMDNITAGLYSGSSGLVPGKGTVERQSANAFAAMKLKDLLVSGYMTEDGGMDVAIMLDSFAMSDEREGKTQIRQLMDKKPGKERDKFVQLKFAQNNRGDKDIVLNSSAFFLFLCPEFLGQLSSFFVVPQPPEEANVPPEVLAKRKQQAALTASNTAGGPAVAAAPVATPATSPKPAEPQAAGALAIRGAINDIEVILIENSLQPKTSQALILSLSMLLDGDTKDGKQIINGEVKDLQIVSTYFEPEMRKLAHYDVLKKLSIVLAVEIDQATQGQIVSVKMDDVHLKVSPAVIRLLSAVGQQFSEHRVENNQNDDEKPVLLKYPGYYNKTKIVQQQYWWFNNCAEEAVEGGFGEIPLTPTVPKVEEASFSIDSFVITLEAGSDEDTVPMILVEASLKAVAKDWSSKLSCDVANELQISYYNEAFSVWEPVIEPVLSETEDGGRYWNPWTVKMSVRTNNDDALRQAVYEGNEEGEPLTAAQLPPKMQINIDAVETLNITVTKSFLKLLTQLGIAFERAAKQASPPKSRTLPGSSPYLIFNDTGLTVKVANSDSMKVSESGEPIDATHGDFVELNVVGWEQKIGLSHADDNRKADLCIEMLETQREVSVLRADTHSVRLPRHAPSGRQWVMVVDTNIENSRRIVNLKSLVSFVNHTSTPLEIHSLRDTNLDLCGTVGEDDDALNVPIPLLYTATGEFFIRPANEQYDMSNEGITWHDFEHEKRATVRCDCTADTKEGVYFDLVALEEPVLGEIGTTAVDRQWTVHIYPPMVFRNCLPFTVNVSTSKDESLTALEGGEDVPVNLIAGQTLTVKLDYEEPYTAHFDIRGDRSDLEIITFVADNDLTKELYLGIHWSTQHRRQDCQLYAPYWLVNNTNKELRYLPEFCVNHAPGRNPVLLPFADKGIASKKKARVRVGNSAWSDEFPLDAAGSAARVTCKENGNEYELTVDTQVCQSGLTKVLSFSPFYLLYNDSKFDLEVKEPDEDEWVHAPAASCTALWPKQKSKRKLIQARYANTQEPSLPFPFTENFEAFCPIDSDLLGIYATCSVGESSSIVHIEPFEPGMCPAVLMNATDLPIEYGQKGQSERSVLQPNELVPFRWRDLNVKDRKLEWSCGEYAAEEELVRNAYGSFISSRQTGYWYWVSFLHGRQRYFVFTDDLAVMTTAQQTYEAERMDMATEMNIQGIGISIVNNLLSQEILYMGISCSGILWEKRVKTDRYKAFAVKDITAIEEAYQKWLAEGSPEGKSQITLSGNATGIDFSRKILYRKGKKSELALRRNYANGLWLLFRQSAHQKQVHLKLNHVQIDNQLPACVFPCVLAVVPPPKSVVADNAPKPFTELAMIMQQPEHSSIVQYKYLHVLIQEFAVRVDQGLINSLIEMFATEQGTAPYNKEMFQKDLDLTKPHLQEKAVTTAASQQKAFYDDLHISPLMIHLSFSQGGTPAGQTGPQPPKSPDDKKNGNGGGGGINIQSEFINVLLKSVGVTLTELQDVVFKLAFFERRAQFYSMPQLQAEIQSHYTMQFIKQLYVLVLGLDIIGNPFGLVRDLSSGVEDLFYQPFQGAIQGPEEFVDGLALGVTSLLGHAVGGAAGAVSRITGTLGKGVAALTLDEEYQRKRQEAINRRPQNFGEGISRGAKGLGQGFYDGVTGIVTKPVEGMRTGGFGGLVKGVGKGLVGAVTRPVSGVVDFASSSLDAVKTVAGTSHEAKALRPARVILQDQIVRPYNFPEAIGYKFFRDTEHGKFADTDHYVAHALISDKIVFVVTDKRVLLARRQDILGTWVADWDLEYEDINSIKTTDKGGIAFELKQKKKGFLGFGGSRGKLVELRNAKTAEHIAERALAAHNQTL
uniref:VPS13_mid_rpt domain-containing protein n=1 Tax=Panagrellus redivivus TaxID=6233 RepID=A0A7E4VBS0_PANRE